MGVRLAWIEILASGFEINGYAPPEIICAAEH